MERLIDKKFVPMIYALNDFKKDVANAEHKTVTLCVERELGYNYIYKIDVFANGNDERNYAIVERIVKTLLWAVGGYKIYIAGDKYIGAGAIAGFIYLMIFAFARLNVPTASEGAVVAAINPTVYYWSLLAIPVIVLTVGVPYVLGARKIELQQARIREKQRQIYGE